MNDLLPFLMTIVLLITSLSVSGTDTLSIDKDEASKAEASLSGTTEDDIDLREEEVQLQEDPGFDPTYEELDRLELEDEELREEEIPL